MPLNVPKILNSAKKCPKNPKFYPKNVLNILKRLDKGFLNSFLIGLPGLLMILLLLLVFLIPSSTLPDAPTSSSSSQAEEDTDRLTLVLAAWKDQEGEGATQEEMLYILEGLKLQGKVEGVF